VVGHLKISELAERAGVNVSTVRYYERAGLVPDPERSRAGYRLYGPDHETRLLLITRARRLGLSLEQISDLLDVWDGSNCASTRSRLDEVLEVNLADIAARIVELERFGNELRAVRTQLAGGPERCDRDVDCCTPDIPPTTPVRTTTIGESR
jgi:DNA-binding transcriptional MerR regulator